MLAPAVSDLTPGTNRFGFGLFDRSRKQIQEAPVAIYAQSVSGGPVLGPFVAHDESLAVQPDFKSDTVKADPNAAQSVYVANVRFNTPGNYRILGVARLDGRLVAATLAGPAVRVQAHDPVPAVGEKPPPIDTPTTKSVGGDVSKIDTRTPPDDMHKYNLKDVLGKKPIVLVFATPLLCVEPRLRPGGGHRRAGGAHDARREAVRVHPQRDLQQQQGDRRLPAAGGGVPAAHGAVGVRDQQAGQDRGADGGRVQRQRAQAAMRAGLKPVKAVKQ